MRLPSLRAAGFEHRELARRGRIRLDEARQAVAARAVARGEKGLMVTSAMVRQEMARGIVEKMQAKVGGKAFRLFRMSRSDARPGSGGDFIPHGAPGMGDRSRRSTHCATTRGLLEGSFRR